MTKDIRVKLEDKVLIRKFDQVQEYMIQETASDKKGNAAAMRFAIQLAHEKMQERQKEEKETIENYQELKQELERMAEKL